MKAKFAGHKVDEAALDAKIRSSVIDCVRRQVEWESRSSPTVNVCTGPVKYRGEAAVQRDIANVKAAVEAAGVPHQHVFLPATASSGVGIWRAKILM